jgi:hypothetical protein
MRVFNFVSSGGNEISFDKEILTLEKELIIQRRITLLLNRKLLLLKYYISAPKPDIKNASRVANLYAKINCQLNELIKQKLY